MCFVKVFSYMFYAVKIEGILLHVVALDIQHAAFILGVMPLHYADKTIGH